MAGPMNNINFMALMNPEFAAKQQSLARQQEIAKQIMDSGNAPEDINKLANPGGFVVPYSPLQGLAKAGEKIAGAYMQKQIDEKQMDAYKELAQSMNQQATPQGQAFANGIMGNNSPSISDIYNEQLAPEWAKAHYQLQNAGPMKAAETSATPYITPQGTYEMGSQIIGHNVSPPAPVIVKGQSQAPANMDELSNQQSPSSEIAKPVELTGANEPQQNTSPLASDGKPLLPNLTNIAPADPSGVPKFKTENTKTGVEQTIQDQKDSAEGNKAFATTAQSLGQEKSRLDNMIQVYKDVQSGSLTAQNPELINKLVGFGIIRDPAEIKDLAGVQNAIQNHILQIIQQIKDTNANAGGGAPTRIFGSEINELLENGESTKSQPEALWNLIGQAKGVVDHHLDMVNGWVNIGGLGNRLAGGYTMRPDDYATQFSTSHNISDYRDRALKDMGPFKGMAGNDGLPVPVPAGVTPDEIKAEMARRVKK